MVSLTDRASWALALFLTSALTIGCRKATCDVEQCDIREATCQAVAAHAAACFRGDSSVSTPVTVIPRSTTGEMSTPPTNAQVEAYVLNAKALSLYLLAKADVTLQQTSALQYQQVGAYYSSSTKAITIIDDGYPLDGYWAVAMLVHENVHALQDRDGTLGKTSPKTFDEGIAVSALIEGEAAFIEDRATLAMFGTREDSFAWNPIFDHWQSAQRSRAFASEVPLALEYSHVSYAFGEPIVRDAYLQGGEARERSTVQTPPLTTRRLLQRSLGDPKADGDVRAALEATAVPDLGAPYSFYSSDALGAWALEQFLGRLDQVDLGRTAAAALAGDTYVVHIDDTRTNVVGTWHLRFDDAATAAAVLAAVSGRLPWRVWQTGADVVLVGASNGTFLERLPNQPPLGPLPAASPAAAATTTASAGPRDARTVVCAPDQAAVTNR